MSKKLSYYWKSGFDGARKTMKRKSLKERFNIFVYVIVSFICKILLIPAPLFAVANYNIGNMIVDSRNISVEKGFENIKGRFGQLWISYFVKFLSLVIGALLICALPALFMVFVYLPNQSSDLAVLYFGISIALIVVFGVIAIIYIAVCLINMKPMAYLAKEVSDFNAGDIMFNAKIGLAKEGKWKIFFLDLFYTVLLILFLGIFGLLIYFSIFFSNSTNGVSLVFMPIIVLLLIIFGSSIIPTLVLGKSASVFALLRDVVPTKKYIVVRPIVGHEDHFTPIFNTHESSEETFDLSKVSKKKNKNPEIEMKESE